MSGDHPGEERLDSRDPMSSSVLILPWGYEVDAEWERSSRRGTGQ